MVWRVFKEHEVKKEQNKSIDAVATKLEDRRSDSLHTKEFKEEVERSKRLEVEMTEYKKQIKQAQVVNNMLDES